MSLRRLGMCADLINRHYDDYSLLDVGCRTMDLKPMLRGCREYSGTDFVPGENIFECDLEKGLPFEDDAFDVVAALDVLEHLENAHATLQEVFRVARKAAFISLPNMYYVSFRLNFLRGRGISGKYAFPPHRIADRHRWVLSYSEALEFVYRNATPHRVSHQMIVPARGRTRLISGPIEKWLGATWPDLFAYGVLFKVELDQQA